MRGIVFKKYPTIQKQIRKFERKPEDFVYDNLLIMNVKN